MGQDYRIKEKELVLSSVLKKFQKGENHFRFVFHLSFPLFESFQFGTRSGLGSAAFGNLQH